MYRKESSLVLFEVIFLFKVIFFPLLRPRRQPRVDDFEIALKQAAHSSSRGPYFGAAHVNMQNMMEFNKLKYRGENTLVTHQISYENILFQFPR